MEGPRFLIAIVLSIAVVILVNVMFPPVQPTRGPAADSVFVDTPRPGPGSEPDRGLLVDTTRPAAEPPAPEIIAATGDAPPAGEDTIWVRSDVGRYGISTRGAGLVVVELLEFESQTRPGRVDLVDPTLDRLVGFAVRVGDRTVDLDGFTFQSSVPPGDTLRVGESPATVRLRGPVGGTELELVYTFLPQRYIVEFEGRIDGLRGADATFLLDLGPRLSITEADSARGRDAMAYVFNSRRDGIESVRINKVDQDRVDEGPFTWVALKSKYFLAAALQSSQETPFGGILATGGPAGAESVRATLPVDRSGGFSLRFFFGPQEYSRLSALGYGLEDVNPYGWRVFRPIIRPLAHLVTWLLTGLHNVLGLGYGWVLILFGFAMRGLLWPLNAKAMRSQLKTMELQPRIKEIQTKHKGNPEQLQKEMMKLYKEEGFNPLGGCLPMLLPWPILITLFFVFQDTIEFRGVEFLWLPDLSQADPLYILPVLLGASLFALQYMNMRAAPQQGAQQKMLMYFMPVMMVVIFLNFASGLNLYYAASNVASLPQQIQIIRERKRARLKMEAKKDK